MIFQLLMIIKTFDNFIISHAYNLKNNLIDGQVRLSQPAQLRGMHPDSIRGMIYNVSFIADHFRAMKKDDQVSEDWVLHVNALYDNRPPITINPAIKPPSGDTLELFVNSS
uniref:Uncharacterized protein n=2 Tax=Wuchereria bancrofti TaxID=6293 RepID=A0AAF5Q6N1_WUCBA